MFNITAIVPLKRINDLTIAYQDLIALGYNKNILLSSYNTFFNKATDLLNKSVNKHCKAALKYNYNGISAGASTLESAEISLSNENHYYINIINNDIQRDKIEDYIQSILMQLIMTHKKGSIKLCLIDAKNAGSSYGGLINIAKSDLKNYGGQVFSTESEITSAIAQLEKRVSENITDISGQSDSVFSYNRRNEKQIPVTTLVIFDYDVLNNSQKKQLNIIEQNSLKAGINIIKVSDTSNDSADNECFNIRLLNGKAVISINDFEAECEYVLNPFTAADIEKACEQEKINTIAGSYFDVNNIEFNMDSTDKLKIPFAIDEYGEINFFEIGGRAPAHALISGETGSGKSVLLHTIIDSITMHYHPDDVEIWAIDYKAVEFACYVEKRTPHISVIGQDKSDDFSYSLLELINDEYERRKKLFIDLGVNNFKDCRAKGERISRLVIVIDEFHNLTQSVQQEQKYKTMLENLLSEMRAMGMAFIFCSQTISSGLQGLTEKGRNQIGCRLCMKQSSIEEIKSTLSETISSSSLHSKNIMNFGVGQVLYRRSEEQGFSYNYLNVLYIDDELREKIIDNVMIKIGDNYIKRHEVICKNSERFLVSEKPYHTLNRFIGNKDVTKNDEGIVFYPAAPTTLNDEFSIKFERTPASNMIICGENDDLRESLVLFSIMSLLMENRNIINVSIFDTENSDCSRLNSILSKISSPRLNIFFGPKESFEHIYSLKKPTPTGIKNQIEFFYGVNKIRSATFLLSQDSDDKAISKSEKHYIPGTMRINTENVSAEEKLNAMKALAARLTDEKATEQHSKKIDDSRKNKDINYSFDETVNILLQLFEHGPDFGYFSFLIINNVKQLKQSNIKRLNDFEFRIGMQMSGDDSYTLFSSENFVRKADNKTVVYYSGSSKNVKTLRPYLMPDDSYLNNFNRRLCFNND